MTEHIQVFDYHRNKQGILHFGLYDHQSGLVLTKSSTDEGRRENAIAFLEECWKIWGKQPPHTLVMDSSRMRKSLIEYLDAKGVNIRLVHPGGVQFCAPLERAFKRTDYDYPAPTGETPVPTEHL